MAAHFGLDISTTSIKVVRARMLKDGFELLAFGEVEAPVSVFSNNPADEEVVATVLKRLLDDSKITVKDVYMSLPESQVYTRVLNLPLLSDKELESAVKFEAEQYIPVPLEEVYLEYQILFKPPVEVANARMEVLLVAAKKKFVEKLVKIAQIAELTPIVIEPALISTLRVLKSQLSDNSLLVEMGDVSSDVAIIMGGKLRQSSSVASAGQALTRAVSQNLALNEQQAKQYKHTYGMEMNQLEGKVAMAMKQPMTQILNHLVKNIRFVKSLGKNANVDQIIVSGGTSLLPGLTPYLVDQLNVEVNLANPFQNCKNRNLPQQLISAGPRFSSVIGLAIRE
jgi:type IV pilus assembly protein PilM